MKFNQSRILRVFIIQICLATTFGLQTPGIANNTKTSIGGFQFETHGSAEKKIGISQLKDFTKKNHRLAITDVNPIADNELKLRDFFEKDTRRPLTWDEANQGCNKLSWENLDWRLPSPKDMARLYKAGYDFIFSNKKHPSGLSSGLTKHPLHGAQFSYIWTSGRDKNLPRGLRMAFNPHTGRIVSHTKQKPLQVICVSSVPIIKNRQLL